jgi:phytanoyl-CoA hydroxylase
MWAVPRSHKTPTTCFLKAEQGRVWFEGTDVNDISGAEPIEVNSGSVVIFHGDLVHFSHSNTSDRQRHAYTFHIVESENCFYESDNWLQRKEIPFKYFY